MSPIVRSLSTIAVVITLMRCDHCHPVQPREATAGAARPMAWETFDPKEIGDCVTIDSSANDNGALQCVRDARAQMFAPHDSVATAMTNLSNCVGSSMNANLGIVGHGLPGALIAG